MQEYVKEVKKAKLDKARSKDLKERLESVKSLSHSMFIDAYELMVKLGIEKFTNSEYVWEHDLANTIASVKFGDFEFGKYSEENLHPIRHLEEYLIEIKVGNISTKRISELTERLRNVLVISTHLHYDADRLIELIGD